MTFEQLENRLRALELVTKGFDYVRANDERDAKEDGEKQEADRIAALEAERIADKAQIEQLALENARTAQL